MLNEAADMTLMSEWLTDERTELSDNLTSYFTPN